MSEGNDQENFHVCVYSNTKRRNITSLQIQNFEYEDFGEQSEEFKKKGFLYKDSKGKTHSCQILAVESK